MLVDEGLEHSFVTQECKEAFEEAVAAACERRLQGNSDPFSWDEEWELKKVDDEDNGVWIIAVTEARSVLDSVEQCVRAVLDKAMQKFRSKRWADLQIVVLETSALTPRLQAAQAVGTFEPDHRGLIDHFLLVDGEEIAEASAVVAAWLQEREVGATSLLHPAECALYQRCHPLPALTSLTSQLLLGRQAALDGLGHRHFDLFRCHSRLGRIQDTARG